MEFFTPCDLNNEKAKCDICKDIFIYKSSTINLRRHLQQKHPTVNIRTDKTTEKQETFKTMSAMEEGNEAVATTSKSMQQVP